MLLVFKVKLTSLNFVSLWYGGAHSLSFKQDRAVSLWKHDVGVCVFDGPWSFQIMMVYMCVYKHILISFSLRVVGCRCGCSDCRSPAFSTSFMASLFRNLGCECIPTFQSISLRMSTHAAPKHISFRELIQTGLNFCFVISSTSHCPQIKPDWSTETWKEGIVEHGNVVSIATVMTQHSSEFDFYTCKPLLID